MLQSLATFARYEVGGFLLLLTAIIAWRLLTGGIVTKGLLTDADGKPSANEVQLLFFTFLGAGWYLVEVIEQGTLPPVPAELLLLVGASHGTFSVLNMRRGKAES